MKLGTKNEVQGTKVVLSSFVPRIDLSLIFKLKGLIKSTK